MGIAKFQRFGLSTAYSPSIYSRASLASLIWDNSCCRLSSLCYSQQNLSDSPNTPLEHAALLNPFALNVQAPKPLTTKFSTIKGDITIQVTRSWAPRGADRFYNLARVSFFADAPFFRTQFGISAQPDIAQAWANAAILDDPVAQSNKRVTITFAIRGPNTRTTQVFINTRDNTALDSQGFAPFGQAIEGMEIVDRLYAGYGDAPRQDRMTEGKS